MRASLRACTQKRAVVAAALRPKLASYANMRLALRRGRKRRRNLKWVEVKIQNLRSCQTRSHSVSVDYLDYAMQACSLNLIADAD